VSRTADQYNDVQELTNNNGQCYRTIMPALSLA
jgi:hypothetical protein